MAEGQDPEDGMQPAPLVSLVMLSLEKFAFTRATLANMLATVRAPAQFVLVDNGSGAEVLELLRGFRRRAIGRGHHCEIVENERNLGCTGGRNQGLALAESDVVCFIDNDVAALEVGWAERLRAALDADRGLAGVGPRLLFHDQPELLQSAGGFVTPRGEWGILGRGRRRDDPRFLRARELQWLPAACLMVRTDLARRVGGHDEAYELMGGEDIDFCFRLRETGHRLRLVPEVELLHHEGTTTGATEGLNPLYFFLRNRPRFRRRWSHMYRREAHFASDAEPWRRKEEILAGAAEP